MTSAAEAAKIDSTVISVTNAEAVRFCRSYVIAATQCWGHNSQLFSALGVFHVEKGPRGGERLGPAVLERGRAASADMCSSPSNAASGCACIRWLSAHRRYWRFGDI